MKKIRFAMVGAGWRGQFFARIAKELPQQFELTGTWLHSPEKAQAWQNQFGGRIAREPEELLKDKPEFLVQAVAKPVLTETLIKLLELDAPILCETTPFIRQEDGIRLWDAVLKKKARVQIAEQYPDHPLCKAWSQIIGDGMIGDVSNLTISAVHSYHAVSLIRMFLNTGFQNAKLYGHRYFFPVRASDSRGGVVLNGNVKPECRDQLTFVFDNGKTAFFDWGNIQYYSFIRSKRINIQGDNGEIDGLTVRYLNKDTYPIEDQLSRRDFGPYNNNPLSHYGIMLGGRYLYRNPFPYARLNDDEIAIASCLARMGAMLEGQKTEVYSLENAMQDAYLALKMEQALTHPGEIISTETQPWAERNK